MKVAVPDELDGSIRYHTFPGVPQMTAGKLCRVIAHQFGITNPEDHGLYVLFNSLCLYSDMILKLKLKSITIKEIFSCVLHLR